MSLGIGFQIARLMLLNQHGLPANALLEEDSITGMTEEDGSTVMTDE